MAGAERLPALQPGVAGNCKAGRHASGPVALRTGCWRWLPPPPAPPAASWLLSPRAGAAAASFAAPAAPAGACCAASLPASVAWEALEAGPAATVSSSARLIEAVRCRPAVRCRRSLNSCGGQPPGGRQERAGAAAQPEASEAWHLSQLRRVACSAAQRPCLSGRSGRGRQTRALPKASTALSSR